MGGNGEHGLGEVWAWNFGQMHPARIILRQQEGRTVWLEAQGCVLSLPPSPCPPGVVVTDHSPAPSLVQSFRPLEFGAVTQTVCSSASFVVLGPRLIISGGRRAEPRVPHYAWFYAP